MGFWWRFRRSVKTMIVDASRSTTLPMIAYAHPSVMVLELSKVRYEAP